MRITMIGILFVMLSASNSYAAVRSITMNATPAEVAAGSPVRLECTAAGGWLLPLVSAKVTVTNTTGINMITGQSMTISGSKASYEYLAWLKEQVRE